MAESGGFREDLLYRLRTIVITLPPLRNRVEDIKPLAIHYMLRQNVGGLPVVDVENKVVGVITDSDIFKVLVSITGVMSGGLQFGFELSDVAGSLKSVLDDLKALDTRVLSILTNYDDASPGTRHVYVRIQPVSEERGKAVIERLKANHNLLYWARDDI